MEETIRVLSSPKIASTLPPPANSKRIEIRSIVGESFTNIYQLRSLDIDSIVDIDIPNHLCKIYFNDFSLVSGRMLPVQINDSDFYVNGVHIKNAGNYVVYQEGTKLVIEIKISVGYRIEASDDIKLIIRAADNV